VCQAVDVELEGRTLTIGNLHATNNSDIARVEAGIAADFVASAERCILCGDFNVPAYEIQDYSQPIEGIDQILVRGVEFERTPSAWPLERRRVNGGLLSDHAPVEAEVAWT
jgi:endonuclease/exonuclease/phosphatase family metal-dependent hydrolase